MAESIVEADAAAESASAPAAGIVPTKHIWFNGTLVPWEQATVHVMTHALHYGSSVFEGIRCYATPRGPALFRATAHLERLRFSAAVYRMSLIHAVSDLLEACKAVVRANDLTSAYLRPLVWRGYGSLGVLPLANPVEVMVAALEWGAYLGAGALERGVDAGGSSWARPAPNTIPAMAKAGGTYLSSQLIALEAHRHGYAEGIALDVAGHVSEGSGENLFLVRDGVLVTPPVAAQLLPGITRDAVRTLASSLGYEVREEAFPREALYAADELFFTGTAVEITPIRSVDGIVIGTGGRGPVTAALQDAFIGIVRSAAPDRWS